MKPKVKVEVVRPVFCVVEQTKHATMDRYRVAVHTKLVKDKMTAATSITLDGVTYIPVESEKPTIDGHHLRQWCATHNGISWQERKAKAALQEQERLKNWKAAQAQREEERKLARQARWQERRQGAEQARPYFREVAIRKRMMDEVETGQQALPKGLHSLI